MKNLKKMTQFLVAPMGLMALAACQGGGDVTGPSTYIMSGPAILQGDATKTTGRVYDSECAGVYVVNDVRLGNRFSSSFEAKVYDFDGFGNAQLISDESLSTPVSANDYSPLLSIQYPSGYRPSFGEVFNLRLTDLSAFSADNLGSYRYAGPSSNVLGTLGNKDLACDSLYTVYISSADGSYSTSKGISAVKVENYKFASHDSFVKTMRALHDPVKAATSSKNAWSATRLSAKANLGMTITQDDVAQTAKATKYPEGAIKLVADMINHINSRQ